MSPALFTNQDAAIAELTAKLAKVTAERDRARDIAVALEQEVAQAWEDAHKTFCPRGVYCSTHLKPGHRHLLARGGAA